MNLASCVCTSLLLHIDSQWVGFVEQLVCLSQTGISPFKTGMYKEDYLSLIPVLSLI